ncbi:MAG: molybdate ABC transporter substrate-binding protein [Hyphomicrobiales bacterium]
MAHPERESEDHRTLDHRTIGGRWIAIGLGLVLILSSLLGAANARADDLLVFAAASQRNALDGVIEAYGKAGKGTVKASYQSSSTLARQIEQGGPADIFISANPKWMNYLSERKLIDEASRSDMFGNGLVLVAAKDGPAQDVKIDQGFDLASLLGDGKLAVGDPDHVPAGIYAKQALQKLGAWEKTEAKLARADNVRAALALVSRGETPYGIVYSSDAVADKGVKVVGTFPESSHPPIVYPVAVMAASKNAAKAKEFLAFLKTPEAVKIYQQYGFRVLGLATN